MSADQQIWILYIEDDSGQARLMQKRLARAGYAVQLATSGTEGIAFFDQHAFDILIVDYQIPGISGLGVIKRLAAKGCLPPTVMVTGAGDERTAVEAMKLGAGDYLVKDPDGVYLELLPVILERLLEQKRLAEAKKEAENALLQSYAHLEQQVAKRTEELTQANQALESEIRERKHAQELLREAHDDLEVRGQEIDDLPLALVSPLGSDNGDVRHGGTCDSRPVFVSSVGQNCRVYLA